jgi:hypothetical protein
MASLSYPPGSNRRVLGETGSVEQTYAQDDENQNTEAARVGAVLLTQGPPSRGGFPGFSAASGKSIVDGHRYRFAGSDKGVTEL